MSEYYVMTNWGPMRASNRSSGNVTKLTEGAPSDMDTFKEVYDKYKELEDRLNAMGVSSVGNWLIKEVITLPTASESTTNAIYKDKNGNSYATYNSGTESSPKYEWVSIGTNQEETDPIWNSEKGNYYTRTEIDSKNYLTQHQDIASKQDVIADLETIRKGASLGATALQVETYKGTVTSINNISPEANGNVTLEIPEEITETTVTAWGFTKNAGDYSKPATGIPLSDLSEEVQSALSKADSALQDFTETDPIFTASPASKITEANITTWNSKSDFSGSYNDLTDTPEIPSIEGLETETHAEATYVKKVDYDKIIAELTARIVALEGGSSVTQALGYYTIVEGDTSAEMKANCKNLTEDAFIELVEATSELTIKENGMIVVLTPVNKPTVYIWDDLNEQWVDMLITEGRDSMGGPTRTVKSVTYNLWGNVATITSGDTDTIVKIKLN